MKLYYQGKYNEDEQSLPQRQHEHHAVPFKEPQNMKQLALLLSIGSIMLMLLLVIPCIFIIQGSFMENYISIIVGIIASCLIIPVHELLHAVCFKEDVYMYSNIQQGMFFVVGVEDMSKFHYIMMCLCPNMILGVIPYLLFFVNHSWIGVGVFGLVNIAMGFGDHLNVYHALTQMPKGSKTYTSGMHSYWYKERKS